MRKLVLFSVLALALLALTGCFGKGRPAATEAPASTPAPTEEPTPAPTEEPTPTPTEEPTPAPTEDPTAALGEYARECVLSAAKRMDRVIEYVAEDPIAFDSSTHPFVPADMRSRLSEEGKGYYDLMLEAAESFAPLELTGSFDEALAARDALLFDRPDIETYFTMMTTGTKNSDPCLWYSVYFLPEGPRAEAAEDMEAVKAQAEAFRAVGEYVASRVPEDFSVIDKYRALAYYISSTSQYCYAHGRIPPYATGAYGALINGYSICQGYTIGFEYLCRCANLNCRRVRNAFNDDNMHFWDIVTLDGGTYYVDVTWADGSASTFRERGWFEWFMFTADRHHVSNDGTSTTGPKLRREDWS